MSQRCEVDDRSLGYFLPGPCVVCEKPCTQGVCEHCLSSLEPLPTQEICVVCGSPLLGQVSPCLECRTKPPPLALRSLWWYPGSASQIVHAIKSNCQHGLTSQLAKCALTGPLGACIDELCGARSWTWCPLPPNPHAMRNRLVDVVDVLAHRFSKAYYAECRRLVYRKPGKAQKSLGRLDRQTNMVKVLGLRGKKLPQRVLLFDDVITTGASMHAVAELLSRAGVAEVVGISLFRA